MMKLIVDGIEFKSKKIAKTHAIGIIKQLIGQDIHEGSEHFGLLMSLWKRSPSFVPGILYFIVAQKFSGAAVKTAVIGDGFIDWSIRSAISGREVGTWTKLTVALRGSIRPQTQEFRARAPRLCELCGSGGRLEVDHKISFKSLMRGYLEQVGQHPNEFVYAHSGWTFTSKDRGFEEGWQKWHEDRCQLRMLCEGCHLRVTLEARMQRPMIRYFGDSDSQ